MVFHVVVKRCTVVVKRGARIEVLKRCSAVLYDYHQNSTQVVFSLASTN